MLTAKDLKIPFSWEERHPVLLDRFFYLPAMYDYQKKEFPFFESDKPIAIEYCSGNGQWIGEKAKRHPEYNWIAVEKRFERARKIWLKLHREGIDNLVVVSGEGLAFTKFYAPKVVAAYVNFPDPWPKLRHAKHRIMREEFLAEVAKILDGMITCATDDTPYYEEMKLEFAKVPEFKLLIDEKNWDGYGDSFFKALWQKRGREIHYVAYATSSPS